MRLLDLPRGTVILDDADLERLSDHSIYIGSNGYAYVHRSMTLHAFVMGGARAGYHIDHINGNRLDNRRANLRYVTAQVNQANRKRLSSANTSGVRGVQRSARSQRNPWRAQITVARKNVHLGLFPTLEDAIKARREAEVRYYGEECPRA